MINTCKCLCSFWWNHDQKWAQLLHVLWLEDVRQRRSSVMKICQLEFDRKLKKNLPLRKKMNPRKRGKWGRRGMDYLKADFVEPSTDALAVRETGTDWEQGTAEFCTLFPWWVKVITVSNHHIYFVNSNINYCIPKKKNEPKFICVHIHMYTYKGITENIKLHMWNSSNWWSWILIHKHIYSDI